MRDLILIAGMVTLMALPPVMAESGMGYGSGMEEKGMSQGMDKSMDPSKGMGMDQPAVTVSAPASGAMMAADKPVMVTYQAVTGAMGDHVHIYVDGKRVAVLRQLAGSYDVGVLSPGMHKIDVEIVTKEHQHIGVGKEVTVDVR